MLDTRRVHIVDDDAAVRESAAILLDGADYEVTTHDSGTSFLAALSSLDPGCVLLDIHMPRITGLQVQMEMRSRQVFWPVIVLTGQGDVGLAVQAMKNGAFEFLEKPYKNDVLFETLKDALDKLDAKLGESARVANARALVDGLNPRELEVMRGLLAGLPNKLIAYELDLSVRTVEVYRANVMGKLQARSLSTAVRIAMAAGVEPLEERRTDGR